MRACHLFTASLVLLPLVGTPLRAGPQEVETVEKAAAVIQVLAHQPLRCIPPALLHDARGVAIFPHVVKAGFLVDRSFGRGVLLVRQPDGSWSHPVFVSIEGGGVGLEAGVEATDLVLVFKSAGSLDHILRGKGRLTLGSDAAVAAGPIGRDAEVATDRRLKPDVFSYSHSRGLFAGLSVAGSRVTVDGRANDAFYGLRSCCPGDVLAHHGVAVAAVATLQMTLTSLSGPPGPPVILTPVPTVVPVPPPQLPPWHW
jgi:lipid-binding SYLF domain-containing protein